MIFNKMFKNEDYEIYFNTVTGVEITRGRNGKEDPFSLVLPSLLDVGVMGHCKNKCSFCYQGHLNKPNMTVEDFKSIIDQVKHHTNQVALGGRGDPNQHENFEEIVSYARENHVVPNYTTSGIDLTDEQIEISKMCGAVAVSSYDKPYTYKAIERLMDAGIKTNIHFIYSNITHNRAIDILNNIDVWNGNIDLSRLNAIIFLLFKPAGAGKMLDWKPTKDQLLSFRNLVFKPKSVFKVGMDSCLVNHVINSTKANKFQRMSIDTCEGSRMSAYITPDMKMMPCSFANPEQWQVALDEKNIKSVWSQSSEFKSFRKILKEKQNCCPLKL